MKKQLEVKGKQLGGIGYIRFRALATATTAGTVRAQDFTFDSTSKPNPMNIHWNQTTQVEIQFTIEYDFRIPFHDDRIIPRLAGARNKGKVEASHKWKVMFKEGTAGIALHPHASFKTVTPKQHQGPFKVSATIDWGQSLAFLDSAPHIVLLVDFLATHKSEDVKIPLPKFPITVPGSAANKGNRLVLYCPLSVLSKPKRIPELRLPRDLLQKDVYFDFDKSRAKGFALSQVEAWHDSLTQRAPELYQLIAVGAVSLELHGFASEPGRGRYNLQLSNARISDVDVLLKRLFKRSAVNHKLKTIAKPHGETKASRSGKDPQEQRVEIRVNEAEATWGLAGET